MLMKKCGCIKSYCSIIETGRKHHYMLYLDFSNITVLLSSIVFLLFKLYYNQCIIVVLSRLVLICVDKEYIIIILKTVEFISLTW